MDTQSSVKCPRCGEGRLCHWHDLSEEERIIARRLPGTASYSASERESMHCWCRRCWYEETHGLTHDA